MRKKVKLVGKPIAGLFWDTDSREVQFDSKGDLYTWEGAGRGREGPYLAIKKAELKQVLAHAKAEMEVRKLVSQFEAKTLKLVNTVGRKCTNEEYELSIHQADDLEVEYHVGCKELGAPAILALAKKLKL